MALFGPMHRWTLIMATLYHEPLTEQRVET